MLVSQDSGEVRKVGWSDDFRSDGDACLFVAHEFRRTE